LLMIVLGPMQICRSSEKMNNNHDKIIFVVELCICCWSSVHIMLML
jgi:hypothetical protein